MILISKFSMDYVYAAFLTARYAPAPLAPNVSLDFRSAPIDFLAIVSVSIIAHPALTSAHVLSVRLAISIALELTSVS